MLWAEEDGVAFLGAQGGNKEGHARATVPGSGDRQVGPAGARLLGHSPVAGLVERGADCRAEAFAVHEHELAVGAFLGREHPGRLALRGTLGDENEVRGVNIAGEGVSAVFLTVEMDTLVHHRSRCTLPGNDGGVAAHEQKLVHARGIGTVAFIGLVAESLDRSAGGESHCHLLQVHHSLDRGRQGLSHLEIHALGLEIGRQGAVGAGMTTLPS